MTSDLLHWSPRLVAAESALAFARRTHNGAAEVIALWLKSAAYELVAGLAVGLRSNLTLDSLPFDPADSADALTQQAVTELRAVRDTAVAGWEWQYALLIQLDEIHKLRLARQTIKADTGSRDDVLARAALQMMFGRQDSLEQSIVVQKIELLRGVIAHDTQVSTLRIMPFRRPADLDSSRRNAPVIAPAQHLANLLAMLADVVANSGNLDSAIALRREQVGVSADVRGYQSLANLSRRTGRFDQARAFYDSAYVIERRSPALAINDVNVPSTDTGDLYTDWATLWLSLPNIDDSTRAQASLAIVEVQRAKRLAGLIRQFRRDPRGLSTNSLTDWVHTLLGAELDRTTWGDTLVPWLSCCAIRGDTAILNFRILRQSANWSSRIASGWTDSLPITDVRAIAQHALAPVQSAADSGLLSLAYRDSGNILFVSVAGTRSLMAAPVSLPLEDRANLLDDARELLAPLRRQRSAIISYLSTKDTLFTWVFTASGGLRVMRSATKADSVSALISNLRTYLGADVARARMARNARGPADPQPAPEAAIGSSTRGISVEHAEKLDAPLLALREVLLPKLLLNTIPAGSEIVIVPDAQIAFVPFAALPIPGTRKVPLAARYALRFAPSIRVLADLETPANMTGSERERLPSALVVGDPAMPRVQIPSGDSAQLVPLPGAKREALWVSKELHQEPLIGANATKQAVTQRLPSSRIVHFATHALIYSSGPGTGHSDGSSFIALAPDRDDSGLLTLSEIMTAPSIQLSADLVVLSACQTGIGPVDSEGPIAFQRAFIAKGARSLLVTLWSVDDEATALLMRKFYTHWLHDQPRPSKAVALGRAQNEVRRIKRFSDPRYWAAFQLVGAR